jgi:hypothetical protein
MKGSLRHGLRIGFWMAVGFFFISVCAIAIDLNNFKLYSTSISPVGESRLLF